MIHFDLPKQKSSIIKVLGVGGGGSNAVNFMFDQGIEGVDFIICNTDAKALEQSRIPNKIQLGPHLTQGLGAGANPEIGKQATEESLEEIKKILEVNTKMAFVCAGMGGGTGTGGAPIVAKICRDLGILTVGIVTTPFGFEGPRRHKQAELGIQELEPYVDTLLVISNDKLRMQYGNLKMKEAFCKADNVLATAAKCITDIINSKGHIIVDFADVCTVMKNGGVAILGKAEVSGEQRAQRAIEQALNSPLLNDSDIKGAKWILININSAEGDHECTMDELEIINNYLRMQAGESSDVIVGMGYDDTLDEKIGITLIATGFEHKDPFEKHSAPSATEEKKPEKIIMELDLGLKESVPAAPQKQVQETLEPESFLAPSLTEEVKSVPPASVFVSKPEEHFEPLRFELSTEITEEIKKVEPVEEASEMKLVEKPENHFETFETQEFLRRPTNIYASFDDQVNKTSAPEQAEIKAELPQVEKPKEEQKISFIPNIASGTANINIDDYFKSSSVKNNDEPVKKPTPPQVLKTDDPDDDVEFGFVVKEDEAVSNQSPVFSSGVFDNEEEEQKRRAQERIQKLRNISFNINKDDPNSEFETVPAYIRRKMDLFGNTLTSAEEFYSKYTVKTDENSGTTQISSINTFLDGKKPD